MAGPRGVVCSKISKTPEDGIAAIEVKAIPSPATLEKDQVRVAVKSASLNFPELLLMQAKYQYKPKLPFVLCGEGAGIVTEVGSAVTTFKAGDRVFFSTGVDGAAAEERIFRAGTGNLTHLPDTMSFSQGAGFKFGYITGYHALVHRGRLKPGEWLLVTGAAGGMGLAAVQLGKALGAKVIAAASSDKKLEVCKRLGADAIVNYKTQNLKDAVQEITNGEFCDVIYDPVGGDIFDQCVRCVATKGWARLLVIGFADGRIPSLPANMALIKGFDLVGVRAGAQLSIQPELSRQMYAELLKLASEGRLVPYVGSEFPMERAKEALTLMNERKVIGKTCITFNPELTASRL